MAYLKAAIALLVGLLLAALPVSGQVLKLQGGSSTLLNADGGSVEFKAPHYAGNMGLGVYNGNFQFGAVVRYPIHQYTVTAGDDSILFDLPTDWFDGTHYFMARGAEVSHIGQVSSVRLFLGTSSTGFSTGFFQAARSNDPTALFFYDRRLSPNLRFTSRNVVSKYQSSLQGVSWRAQKWLNFSSTGGFGSNHAYAAVGFNIETKNLALKAGYIDTGARFRRMTLVSPLSSEVQKGNVEFAYQPNRIVSINAGHHNILEPVTPDAPFTPASVNEIGANFHVGRSYFGAGYFTSSVQARLTNGTNVYVGRRMTKNVDVTGNYFTSHPQHGPKTDIASGTVRETLSKRISLLQLITRSNGQTTVAVGGDFLTNRLKFRADYQNVYLPYRPARPFEQALALNTALRVHGPLQITAASSVAPDGRPRYSFGVSTYLYRQRGMWNSTDPDSFSFPKYVVIGTVHDPDRAPVEGAAIRIGTQVVYSDDKGEFLLRLQKRRGLPLQVAVSEFLTAGTFGVVVAPSSVTPSTEETAQSIEIVVKRLANR